MAAAMHGSLVLDARNALKPEAVWAARLSNVGVGRWAGRTTAS